MSEEPKVEKTPEAVDLMEMVQANEPWNPVYRRELEDCFKRPAFRAALRELLVLSDEKLKAIGQSDLTNENTIKTVLREQGCALALVTAVETICILASTPENEHKENEDA